MGCMPESESLLKSLVVRSCNINPCGIQRAHGYSIASRISCCFPWICSLKNFLDTRQFEQSGSTVLPVYLALLGLAFPGNPDPFLCSLYLCYDATTFLGLRTPS